VQFAWHVNDPRRRAVQSGYRILVSEEDRSPAVVWDSGPVRSNRQAFVSYAGPALASGTRFRWTVSTADSNGRWSPPSEAATFVTGLRRSDWIALWLRPGPSETGLEEYTYLRTTRPLLGDAISYATAFVAAAHKYQLWVNGTEWDTGPSFCFPDEQYYQATDVTQALLPGCPNTFGILHHWYGPGRGRPTSAPGLLLQVRVHYKDGRVLEFGTDGDWMTRRAEWLPAPQRNNDSGDFVEWIDARMSPLGWSSSSFDDSDWQPATVLGPVGVAPFSHLYAQRTRIVEEEMYPRSVTTLSTGSVVVDFGKVYAGRPTVSFREATDGHLVPMHVGYTLDPDGSVSTTHNTQATDLSFSYIQRGGSETFEPYWYLGFRYLQIDDPGENLSGDQIRLMARHADMPQVPAATFNSSDPALDAVWELCVHSGLYTSQEQFIDTPTREKGQFLWDAANESQTVMRTFAEQNLSWQAIRDMARAQARYWPSTGEVNEIYPNDDGPQNYPTFSALYPEWMWRYYLSTGDAATVVGLTGTLTLLAGYFVSAMDPRTGLVSGQQLSTNGDNQYGYDFDTNADTTLNILTANAFERIAQIAALGGDAATSSAYQERATALVAAINFRLVNGVGLYVDGLRADGSQSSTSSQLANLAALAYGVVPPSQVETVAEFVASLNISVEPDHGMELLRALHAGGRDADVVRILIDPSFPGWAAILAAAGTFTWETWTPSDLVGDSMSHGWGSSALVAMQEILLGVIPAEPPPGGPPTFVTVTTPSAGPRDASGSFPTPSGRFHLVWNLARPQKRLSISVPPNAGARCELKGATVSSLTESGRPVSRSSGVVIGQGPHGSLTLVIGAGSYEFEW